MFDLTERKYWENQGSTKKTKEAINPIVGTVRLWDCVRQNISLRDRRSSVKNNLDLGKSDLNSLGDLVELLSHEV